MFQNAASVPYLLITIHQERQPTASSLHGQLFSIAHGYSADRQEDMASLESRVKDQLQHAGYRVQRYVTSNKSGRCQILSAEMTFVNSKPPVSEKVWAASLRPHFEEEEWQKVETMRNEFALIHGPEES